MYMFSKFNPCWKCQRVKGTADGQRALKTSLILRRLRERSIREKTIIRDTNNSQRPDETKDAHLSAETRLDTARPLPRLLSSTMMRVQVETTDKGEEVALETRAPMALNLKTARTPPRSTVNLTTSITSINNNKRPPLTVPRRLLPRGIRHLVEEKHHLCLRNPPRSFPRLHRLTAQRNVSSPEDRKTPCLIQTQRPPTGLRMIKRDTTPGTLMGEEGLQQ